jgi:hypothetical protein
MPYECAGSVVQPAASVVVAGDKHASEAVRGCGRVPLGDGAVE